MSNLKYKSFIDEIHLDIYLEKESDLSDRFKSSLNSKILEKLYRDFNISKECCDIKIYNFKRYSATDHIDELDLCENYLNFCIDFEYSLAPAILIKIKYRSEHFEKIKISGEDYRKNSENFISYLRKKIIESMSKFFN